MPLVANNLEVGHRPPKNAWVARSTAQPLNVDVKEQKMPIIPNTTTYFFGKVSEALGILATGAGDIKDRLIGAGDVFLCVDPEGIPQDLHDDVQWVHDQLTRFEGVSNEGSLRATMKKIRKSTGVKIAKRIVYIYYTLRDYVEHPEAFEKE